MANFGACFQVYVVSPDTVLDPAVFRDLIGYELKLERFATFDAALDVVLELGLLDCKFASIVVDCFDRYFWSMDNSFWDHCIENAEDGVYEACNGEFIPVKEIRERAIDIRGPGEGVEEVLTYLSELAVKDAWISFPTIFELADLDMEDACSLPTPDRYNSVFVETLNEVYRSAAMKHGFRPHAGSGWSEANVHWIYSDCNTNDEELMEQLESEGVRLERFGNDASAVLFKSDSIIECFIAEQRRHVQP